jgi:hypothetical protein
MLAVHLFIGLLKLFDDKSISYSYKYTHIKTPPEANPAAFFRGLVVPI